MYLDQTLPPFGTVQLAAGAIFVSWILYSLGVAIYNVSFHPLAKYPGPKLWAAFWWPDSLSSLSGRRTKEVHELHRKYGQVVRVNPNTLSFTNEQAWKDICGSRPGKGQMQKDLDFYTIDKNDHLPRNILSANDADHSRVRRLLAHAFSDQALRSQEDIMRHYFQLLVKKLADQVDGPNQGKVDLAGYYNFTTFDIIGDLCFGEPFCALEVGKYHPWILNLFRAIKAGRWLRLGIRYPPLMQVFFTIFKWIPSLRESRASHLAYTKERVESRLEAKTERKDFMTYILRHNDDKGMTRPEIISSASVLIIAGSETTATLLSGATYHLLQNPAKMARLQDEVRSAFGSLDEMTLISTSKLPYLHAVIEESLRMYPPVADMLPRRTPAEGEMVAGQWVPGNTVVGVHHWSTYRDPKNFAQPDTFAPERFLPDAPSEFAQDRKDALQPFSWGPRNCLGKNLAYNEMRSILARVVFAFDMQLCPESQNWTDQKTWIVWEKPPLMVQLRRREVKK